MSRLFFLILTISVTSCAGVGVIAALVAERYDGLSIILFGGIGAVIGVVVAWYVARKLQQREIDHGR